jgi:signal transduction histidine kinase
MRALGTWRSQLREPGSNESLLPWLRPGEPRTPIEAIVMRCVGAAWLVTFLVFGALTSPHPGLHGRGLGILLAMLGVLAPAMIALRAVALSMRSMDFRWAAWRYVVALLVMTACSAVIIALQPNGPWQDGPVLIAIIAALRLDRVAGTLMLALSFAVVVAVTVTHHDGSAALTVLFTDLPWFLVMRLLREIATQRNALNESRAAEARAAAAAERGRLAREMHDVLAHSLSALALQLESTRLLAASRGVAEEVTRAIDRAHQLTAAGLEEARRAIATARGAELPGPDRISALADAFGAQSGLPVALAVRGEPRELAPDARLAVYRTAQEALTNVRRHAAAERVSIELSYLPTSTVLVVEDRAPAGTPAPAPVAITGVGYGLTGMRERAELLGGELLAQPTQDGFRVELRLPQ